MVYIPNITNINQTNLNIINQALFAANTWVTDDNFYSKILLNQNFFLSWIKIMIIRFLYSIFSVIFHLNNKTTSDFSIIINWAVSISWHVPLDPLENLVQNSFFWEMGLLRFHKLKTLNSSEFMYIYVVKQLNHCFSF